MMYRTVEIRGHKCKWSVWFNPIHGDKVEKQTYPNPLGYYHHPITMSKEQAFNELKACIIKAHEEKIADLQKSADTLRSFIYDEEDLP